MSVYRLSYRFAKSLVDHAIDQNALDTVHEDIQTILSSGKSNEFKAFLKSPIIKMGQKREILSSVFKGKVSDLTFKFIETLVSKGREPYLLNIAEEFVVQYKIKNHVSSIKLVTATPVSDENLAVIKKQLLESTATDKDVEIEVSVDPSLIGGFRLEFNDKQYDASIASKLAQLKNNFSNNSYIKNL